MTKIEKAVKIVSDLHDFYRKIPKLPSRHAVKDDDHTQTFQWTGRERVPQPSENPLARCR